MSGTPDDSHPAQSETSAMVKTVKSWIATARERRQAELRNALRLRGKGVVV